MFIMLPKRMQIHVQCNAFLDDKRSFYSPVRSHININKRNDGFCLSQQNVKICYTQKYIAVRHFYKIKSNAMTNRRLKKHAHKYINKHENVLYQAQSSTKAEVEIVCKISHNIQHTFTAAQNAQIPTTIQYSVVRHRSAVLLCGTSGTATDQKFPQNDHF